MTNPDPPAESDPLPDAEAAPTPPVSGCQLQQEADEQPKSLRLLPRITANAVRLEWAASPLPGVRETALAEGVRP